MTALTDQIVRLGHTKNHRLFIEGGNALSYTEDDLEDGLGRAFPGIRVNACIIDGIAIELDEEDREFPSQLDPSEVLTSLTVQYVVFG